MENKTEITCEAVIAMQKTMLKRTQWIRYILAALLLLNAGWQLYWTLTHALNLANNKENSIAFLFCIFIAILLLCTPYFIKKRTQKQFEKQFAVHTAPLINHYFFESDGLRIKDGGVENGRELLLPYENITRFLQDKTYYFLYIKSMNSTYILKKDAFFPNDEVQVMACLQEKLANCKGIR